MIAAAFVLVSMKFCALTAFKQAGKFVNIMYLIKDIVFPSIRANRKRFNMVPVFKKQYVLLFKIPRTISMKCFSKLLGLVGSLTK